MTCHNTNNRIRSHEMFYIQFPRRKSFHAAFTSNFFCSPLVYFIIFHLIQNLYSPLVTFRHPLSWIAMILNFSYHQLKHEMIHISSSCLKVTKWHWKINKRWKTYSKHLCVSHCLRYKVQRSIFSFSLASILFDWTYILRILN